MMCPFCGFARLLQTTPEDLVADGLYSTLAVTYYAEPYRQISIAFAAQELGANLSSRKSSTSRGHWLSFTSNRQGSVPAMHQVMNLSFKTVK
eukprot:6214500-Pleurochrysis_carterae.AAC.12